MLSVLREVPLHVAKFDVCPGVAHDAARFLRNALWCTINLVPGYQLSITRGCVHVRANLIDHVQESVLRDPVRRRVGHDLARKEWSMRVHSVGLCPHDASHVYSKCDRDEGARSEDMG